MLRSQNGLSANDRSKVGSFLIPGTTTRISMRKGNVATILCYVAAEFDKHVEDIDTPTSLGFIPDHPSGRSTEPSRVVDDWGFAFRNVRGSKTTLSNHSSGSAIDLNATQHPRGVAGTFTAAQLKAIRRILADCGDAVRWGGDYRNAPIDEMHWEINANAARVAYVAGRITRDQKAKARAEARAAAADEAIAKHKRQTALAKARAKSAAALATKRRKAAAAAAALAAIALAAGGTAAVVNDPPTTPVPTTSSPSTPGPTANQSPTVKPTVKPGTPKTNHPPRKPPAKPTSSDIRRTLKYRAGQPIQHGGDVRKVQALVGARVDGDFGPATAAKVKTWQRRHHLTGDGEFGRRSALKAGFEWRPR